MDFFGAAILGVVEGVTEFLPISSTGHLILASKLLGITSTNFLKSFEVIIQSGTILAVFALYGKTLLQNKNLFLKVFVSFLPTAVVGLILYQFIKSYLLGSVTTTLWALFLGGIVLILIEIWFKKRPNKKEDEKDDKIVVSYRQAFLIGLVQSISIIPGVSRSAASIIGGMILGLDRKTAVTFSFLLAIPTLLAATGLDLIQTNFSFTQEEWILLAIGFTTSFIVAIASIKFLVSYVKNYSFIPFGVYRIIIALALYFIFFV